MSIVVFLIDTLFFVLVAAALLRAWLNAARIAMWQQPGPFVLAVTDWLVKPLRRGLPAGWQRSRWDVASLFAAVVLALLQASALVGLGGAGQGMGPALLMALPVLAVKILLKAVLQTLFYLALAYAVLSWVQPHAPVLGWLQRLLGPLLQPIRRCIPLVGGVDLSVLLFVVLLQIGLMLLG
jgi:YggT family protein